MQEGTEKRAPIWRSQYWDYVHSCMTVDKSFYEIISQFAYVENNHL